MQKTLLYYICICIGSFTVSCKTSTSNNSNDNLLEIGNDKFMEGEYEDALKYYIYKKIF